MRFFTSLILILISCCLFGQNPIIDSLEAELEKLTVDSLRIKTLTSLISHSGQIDKTLAHKYSLQKLELARKIKDKSEIASALFDVGSGYLFLGKNDSALQFLIEANNLYGEIRDTIGQYMVMDNIALAYQRINLYEEAGIIYLENIETAKRNKDFFDAIFSLVNYGTMLMEQENYRQAIEYLEEAERLYPKLDSWGTLQHKDRFPGVYINLGQCYQNLEELDTAKQYFDKAIEAGLNNDNSNYTTISMLSYAYNSQGNLAITMATESTDSTITNKHLRRAHQALKKGLQGFSDIEDLRGICFSKVDLGSVFTMQGKLKEGEKLLKEGLELAKDIKFREEIRDAYSALAKNLAKSGEFEQAYDHLSKFIVQKDSLFNEERDKTLQTLETKYQSKQKAEELQKLTLENELEKRRNRTQLILFAVLLLLVITVGIIIWAQNRIKQQNKSITLEKERVIYFQRVNQLKDQFLANTSHELRTPLQGIIGLSESLLELEEVEDKRENLSMIISSGKRLNSLVDDILDFSKLKNQDIILSKKAINLWVLTDIVLRNIVPLLKGKNIKLINAVDPKLSAAFADENRVQQILYNLIGNGIKFTEYGSITVEAMPVQDMIQVCVKDTGIGIERKKLQVIFEAFEQADGSISRKYSGTGLGLSISKKLVELHGGDMWVESEEGQGSIFYFTLPLGTETIADPGIISDSVPIKSIAAIQPLRASKAREEAPISPSYEEQLNILVVDDEAINQQVIKNHLQEDRFKLVQAMNGTEALQLLEGNLRFDLVLLDVMMPRMSGYEVCQRIREQYLPSELPVIMVTAKNQVSDLIQGLDLGANDYLAKPFTRDEFLARIKTHLNLHRINKVTNRFVPAEFIRTLGKDNLTELKLGDQVERQVTVLFTDIRKYTSLAEQMSPEENFRFVNAYAGRMGPIINLHNGFVNQYLGDGIMAIFQQSPDDALKACIDMQREIDDYNHLRSQQGRRNIRVGMGMHTGSLIMGIIGDEQRTDAATISDTVNTAARMEALTKQLGAPILLSEQSFQKLSDPQIYQMRYLGRVRVKGREAPLGVYECFDSDQYAIQSLKRNWMDTFDQAITLYAEQSFAKAIVCFEEILDANPDDQIVANLLVVSKKYLTHGVPDRWVG